MNQSLYIRHLFASCLPTAAIDSLMVGVYFAVMFYFIVNVQAKTLTVTASLMVILCPPVSLNVMTAVKEPVSSRCLGTPESVN